MANLRPERRFAGIGQLREAILRDGERAEEYWRRRDARAVEPRREAAEMAINSEKNS